ncbi:MAG: hypothetical protein Tsb0034_30130 [Ekhidna sp.]
MNVTFKSSEAKHFFDQGIIFTYGYNHGEAARSFRESIRLDSTFAMAYWGLAYTLGPNYNAGLDPANKEEILWATEKAIQLKSSVKPWEQGLIEASALKYRKDQMEPDLKALVGKMKMLSEQFPKNAEILTHYGEAMMLQHPWDLYDYKGGPAKVWTPAIIKALSTALMLDTYHPLTNHLYIHATEAAPQPEGGYDAASMLSSLILPGAGHLVHMPSHTYINTGDYHLGTEVNLAAVKADSIYVSQCKVQGAFPLYYYHNYHFLAACAALEGRGALAIEASFRMTNTIDKSLLGEPGFETTQHFMTVPYNVLVKFAQWEKILALPAPDEAYPYMTAIWHYARGMAFANLGKLENAAEELLQLDKIQANDRFGDYLIFGINPGQMVTGIARNVLEAEMEQVQGNYEAAEQLLLKAVEIEDSMSYNEPPDWFFSVRHLLGDLYMTVEAYDKAEATFRADLKNFPKNGFALNGLYWSLIKQDNPVAASEVLKQAEMAWEFADTPLKYSRVDPEKRKELTIRVAEGDPQEMIRLAASFCTIY